MWRPLGLMNKLNHSEKEPTKHREIRTEFKIWSISLIKRKMCAHTIGRMSKD